MIYGCDLCVCFYTERTSKGDPTTYSLDHPLPFQNLIEKDIIFLAYLSHDAPQVTQQQNHKNKRWNNYKKELLVFIFIF